MRSSSVSPGTRTSTPTAARRRRPLVIDGVLYVSTAWSMVKAYDAKTGTLLWSYDPAVPRVLGVRGCCDVVNRGVAAWQGKIFVGAFDGRLIALDARTGKPVEYGVRGYVSAYDADTGKLVWPLVVTLHLLLALQLIIGASMVLSGFPLWLATAHSAGAALLLMAMVNSNRGLRPSA